MVTPLNTYSFFSAIAFALKFNQTLFIKFQINFPPKRERERGKKGGRELYSTKEIFDSAASFYLSKTPKWIQTLPLFFKNSLCLWLVFQEAILA